MSCNSESYTSPLKGQSVEKQIFETGTYTKNLTIGTEDLSKCTILCNVDWCSTRIQGSSIVISVIPNDTYEERQALITLIDPEDATALSFDVVQRQNDAILVDYFYNVPEEGGIVKIKVESNIDYEVKIHDVEWITIPSGTRGLKSSEVVINVAPNDSGRERRGLIELVAKNKSGNSAIVSIHQELIPRVEYSPDTIYVSDSGGSFTIYVKSNIDIGRIETLNNWIEIGEKTDVDGFDFSFKVTISPMTSSDFMRYGSIIINASNWPISKTINIVQEPAKVQEPEILKLNRTSITNNCNPEEYEIKLESNTTYSIEKPSWMNCILISTKYYVNYNEYTYILTFHLNNDWDDRSGEVIFKSKTKEAKISVYQEGNKDIRRLINCYTYVPYYMPGIMTGSLEAEAYIENNSPYTIYLTSVIMKTVSHTLLARYYDMKPLPSGAWYMELYGHAPPYNFDLDGLSCTWTFIYNDKENSVTGYRKEYK